MPTIQLSDDFGLDLVVQPDPLSAFLKYFRDLPRMHAVQRDLSSLMNTPLAGVPPSAASVGLSFDRPFKLGTAGPELTVTAGLQGKLGILTHGQLFEDDAYATPIPIEPNQAYVSFDIVAGLAVAPGDEVGDLGFGFQAGTGVTLANYRRFATTPTSPSLGNALADTLSHYVIPADVDDLQAMPLGAIATVEGTGTITFSATVDLLASVNPLATLSARIVPLVLPIKEAGSVSVGASYGLSGGYQIRVRKLDANRLELGYSRSQGSALDVTVSAEVGVSAKLGKSELIAAVLGAISPNPRLDLAGLELNDAKTALVAGALKKAIERKLELALRGQLEFLASHEEAFLFEIDLGALDVAGRRAIHQALDSDLGALVGNERALPPGITEKKSVFTRLRERGVSLSLNIFGLYNYLSLSDLVRSSTVVADAESGEVVITDAANAARINLATNFLTSDERARLRRVLTESFLLTAVYRSSHAVVEPPGLTGSYWFLDLHSSTSRQNVADHSNVLRALGLAVPAGAAGPAEVANFGRSAFYVDTEYAADAVRAAFLDAAGRPRAQTEYEALGRQAMRAVLVPGEVNDDRLEALDDAHWPRVAQAAGNRTTLGEIFPDASAPVLMDIYGDWFVIANWSEAMAQAARCLAEALPYFSQTPPPDPQSNTFITWRARLARQMASVAEKTKERFAEPWGLVVMDLVSGRKSEVSAEFYSDRLTWLAGRRAAGAALGTAAGTSSGAAPAGPRAA